MNSVVRVIMRLMMLFSISVILTSCGNDKPAPAEEAANLGMETPENIKGSEQLLDSIAKLNSTKQIQSLNEDLKNIKDNTDEMLIWFIVAIAIGTLSFFIAIIAYFKADDSQKRCTSRHREEIKKLKNEIDWIKVGMSDLKSSLCRLSKVISTTSDYGSGTSKPDGDSNPPYPPIETGPDPQIDSVSSYFGFPCKLSETESYFRSTLPKSDPNSRFSAKINGNRAEFTPLKGQSNFNDFRTSESLKLAFDNQGCAPSEAKTIEPIAPGVAELEGSKWVIKRKVKIKFRS